MSRHRVRSLTLAHLDRLVAIGVLANACGRDVGKEQVDPVPTPEAPAEPPTAPRTVGAMPDRYIMGDPPPPPPELCQSLAEGIHVDADDLHRGQMKLDISASQHRGVKLPPASQVTATDATITSATDRDGEIRLYLTMSAPSAVVSLRGSCNGKAERVDIQLQGDEFDPAGPVRVRVVPGRDTP